MDVQFSDFVFDADLVTKGATTTNATHPYDIVIDAWQISSIGQIYELNSTPTVGYINFSDDVDIYYVPNSVGTHGSISNDRYLYIVTSKTASIGFGDGFQTGSQLQIDHELAQGYGRDDPNFDFVTTYNGPYSLNAFYFDNATPSVSWLVFESYSRTSGLKYAIASTPQAALSAFDNTLRTFEQPYNTSAAVTDLNGDGKSDLLIQNTSGAVVVGSLVGGALSYSLVGGLGPEWRFGGNGRFLGQGASDFLIRSASCGVYVGSVNGGVANYTAIGGLGAEWSFRETGDFLGVGQDQFLIENTLGAVYLGNVVGGQTQFTALGGLGPEWSFVGEGNLLGDGKTGFLIRNTSGSLYVGEVSNASVTYTAVGGLGSEWSFRGVGDFLNNGHDQILIQNNSGALWIDNIANGQPNYTQIGGVGHEWSFLGVGDFVGQGGEDFMIRNTSGDVYLGDIAGSSINYVRVGAFGPEWTSHS